MILSKDPEQLSEATFLHRYVVDIMVDPSDIKSGVNGCIPASAYNRLCAIMAAQGADKPIIVREINDPEVELTYIVK